MITRLASRDKSKLVAAITRLISKRGWRDA
jgi:hypothetical protein